VEHVKPDIIVHLAAFTGHGQPVISQYDMPERYAHTNYLGTINLVEAAIKATSVRQFVYAFCYDEETFAYTLVWSQALLRAHRG
jgi:nucleoside-diphosphate-sugar epimerase